MGHVILGKISVFQTHCHIGDMLSKAILLTSSCSTLPKNWIAIITVGHERIYASLSISYQAPHHWDALGVLEFSGLFSSMRWAGLGRNLDLSLTLYCVWTLKPTFPECQIATPQPLWPHCNCLQLKNVYFPCPHPQLKYLLWNKKAFYTSLHYRVLWQD